MKSALLFIIAALIAGAFAGQISSLFDFDSISSGYSINGTFCAANSLDPTIVCYPSRLVVDTPRNRWMLDLGGSGKYVLNSTGAYIFNLIFAPGVCFNVAHFNATVQVENYKRAFSQGPLNAQYVGLVDDVASCDVPVAVSITAPGQIVTRWGFGQLFPLFGQCLYVRANINYDFDTIEFHKRRDADFIVPASCVGAPDFCGTLYPPGHVCQ